MKPWTAKKWVAKAINLFGELGYDDQDAFEAVREIIQKERDSVDDEILQKDLELIAKIFEEDYRKYFGRA